jgi:hypothetical protein
MSEMAKAKHGPRRPTKGERVAKYVKNHLDKPEFSLHHDYKTKILEKIGISVAMEHALKDFTHDELPPKYAHYHNVRQIYVQLCAFCKPGKLWKHACNPETLEKLETYNVTFENVKGNSKHTNDHVISTCRRWMRHGRYDMYEHAKTHSTPHVETFKRLYVQYQEISKWVWIKKLDYLEKHDNQPPDGKVDYQYGTHHNAPSGQSQLKAIRASLDNFRRGK